MRDVAGFTGGTLRVSQDAGLATAYCVGGGFEWRYWWGDLMLTVSVIRNGRAGFSWKREGAMAHSGFRRTSVVTLVPLLVGAVGVLHAASPKLWREVADERRGEALAAARRQDPSASVLARRQRIVPGERLRPAARWNGQDGSRPRGPVVDGVCLAAGQPGKAPIGTC